MTFELSKSIKEGQKIKTEFGWRKVSLVTETCVVTKEKVVRFGEIIYGWKSK